MPLLALRYRAYTVLTDQSLACLLLLLLRACSCPEGLPVFSSLAHGELPWASAWRGGISADGQWNLLAAFHQAALHVFDGSLLKHSICFLYTQMQKEQENWCAVG